MHVRYYIKQLPSINMMFHFLTDDTFHDRISLPSNASTEYRNMEKNIEFRLLRKQIHRKKWLWWAAWEDHNDILEPLLVTQVVMQFYWLIIREQVKQILKLNSEKV